MFKNALLLCSFLLYSFLQAQDTLFLTHKAITTKETKPIYFDSIFVIIRGTIQNLTSREDSIRIDYDHKKGKVIEPYYQKTMKYYTVMDKAKITDSLSYTFWIKQKTTYYVFYAPGNFLFNPRMEFYLYKYRKKWRFWKKKFNGFGVGHFAYISDELYEVNHIGEIPNRLSNKKLTNFY